MRKNKRVYISPEVNGTYVLQSISSLGISSQSDLDDCEIEQKEKEKEREKEKEERIKELELAREEAYKKGYSDAEQNFKQEMEKLKNKYASLVNSFREAVTQFADEREKIWRESEPEIIRLIMAVSKKIIGYEMDNNGVKIIKHIVKEALSYTNEKKIVAVRLSAEDIRKINTLEGINIVDQSIKILEDKTVAPGGCIIETDFGNIDSQIETRWEEVQKALLGNEDGAAVY
jgi:flagellar assembly protein FliH